MLCKMRAVAYAVHWFTLVESDVGDKNFNNYEYFPLHLVLVTTKLE